MINIRSVSKCCQADISNLKKLILLFGLLLILEPAKAETTIGNLTTQVVVTYVPPTCDIGAPSEVNLYDISNGINLHPQFRLSVNCNIAVKTAITARVINGKLNSNTTAVMSNGSFLRIKDSSGNYIKLQGKNDESFCIMYGNGIRFCDLTPETDVSPRDKRGKTDAIVNFKITYPA